MAKETRGRSIAVSIFAVALLMAGIDGLWIHGGKADGLGIAALYVLPPLGSVFAFLSWRRTGSTLDWLLLFVPVLIFCLAVLYMTVGTLVFGV